MAITLTFTDFSLGGDIDLQDSAVGVIQYDPQPPASAEAASVTETIVIYINSGAKAARTANGYIHRLERYFERARRRQKRKTGARIYLQYKPYDADALYRTEILDGRVTWRSGTASAAWLPSDTGELIISFTRKPYFEADTEVELPLANGNGTGAGGRDIVNHNDNGAGHDHWVLIDSTDVIGSLPAPVRMQLENTSASGDDKYFWIAHTIETDDGSGADQIWTLEGEDNEVSPDTPVADAPSSGGEYMPQTWAVTTETEVFRWTLSSAYLVAAAGNPFRAVARFISQGYTDLYLRLSISDSAGFGEIWSSDPMLCPDDEELVDFGTIPSVPPLMGSSDVSGYSTHYLSIYATRAAGGTHTLNLDYLQMLPMDGGLNIIESNGGWGVNTANSITIDGIYEELYRGVPGGGQWAMFTKQGKWIHLVPGRVQRVAFMWQTRTFSAAGTRTCELRMYYRPRRASF